MQEVSVIIPNYNGMAYLEGVLSSLEQQEFQNFETILVDNGSSDGSVAFVMGNFPWVHIVELPAFLPKNSYLLLYRYSKGAHKVSVMHKSPHLQLLKSRNYLAAPQCVPRESSQL